MAYIEDEKKKNTLSVAPAERTYNVAPVGNGPSTKSAPMQVETAGKQGGSGWVNLQTYLGLNQDQAKAGAEKIATPVSREAGAARAQAGTVEHQHQKQLLEDEKAGKAASYGSLADVPGYGEAVMAAQNASAKVKGLTDFNQRQRSVMETFGKDAGGTGYTSGMGKWDNALLGSGAATDVFRGVQDRFGGLDEALGLAQEKSAAMSEGYNKDLSGWQQGEVNAQSAANRDFAAASKAAEQQAAVLDDLVRKGYGTADRNSAAYQRYLAERDKLWTLQRQRDSTKYTPTKFESETLKKWRAANGIAANGSGGLAPNDGSYVL